MVKRKVALDLDNTLNDFTSYFFTYVFNRFGIDSIVPLEEIDDYDVKKFLNVPTENAEYMLEEALADVNFWEKIPVRHHAKELVSYLFNSDYYEPIIVTHPWNFQYSSILGKLNWIRFNFKEYEDIQIHFRNDKWNGNYDIVLDDDPKYLSKFREIRVATVKMLHKYNRDVLSDYIVKDCKEALEIFKKLEASLKEKK